MSVLFNCVLKTPSYRLEFDFLIKIRDRYNSYIHIIYLFFLIILLTKKQDNDYHYQIMGLTTNRE